MTQTLFAAQGNGGPTGGLYTSSVTAVMTPVGSIPWGCESMAFDKSDLTGATLYGCTTDAAAQPDKLISINPATGAGTVIAALSGATSGSTMADIDTDAAGNLYGLNFNPSNGFVSINKATGLCTLIANLGGLGFQTLAINPIDGFGYTLGSGTGHRLYRINLGTGGITLVGTITGIGGSPSWRAATFDAAGILWVLAPAMFSIDIGALVATSRGFPTVGNLTSMSWRPPPPPPPPPPRRFFEGYPWKFIFTDLGSVVTTWAQGLLTQRTVVLSLGEAEAIEADVWPDDIRINEIFGDGYPRVAQSIRMVHAFRRDGQGITPFGNPAPWSIRAAGVLMAPEDQADADIPLTHFAAYGPRKLLEARACVFLDGSLPGPLGMFFSGTPVATIALTLLRNTIVSDGTVHIDAGPTYGGTTFYTGTVEATGAINFNVQQGQMVADAWRDLEATGKMNIILEPIYDPINRPGYTHQISIYALAGQNRYDAVFGWDRMNRALNKIDRMHSAVPGDFFDKVQYYAGQGGAPVPPPPPAGTGPLTNAPAIAAFGVYWAQQFFPTQTNVDPSGATVLALAQLAIQLSKQGKRTITLHPTAERAPIPLIKYDIGDRVPVYASKNLRVGVNGGFGSGGQGLRVLTIPFEINDESIETVNGLLVTPDWVTSPDPFVQADIAHGGPANLVAVTDSARPRPTQVIVAGQRPR